MDPERFDRWVRFVFDRPAPFELPDPRDDPEAKAPAADIADFMAHLLEHCGVVLAGFSDDQLNMGIRYLVTFDSEVPMALRGDDVPIDKKLRVIAGFRNLYADCFEPRCAPCLASCNEAGNALNHICYMLWDVSPLTCWDGESACDDALIDMLAHVLDHAINPACIESALHGLGHTLDQSPIAAVAAIDRYLAKPATDARLTRYAQQARTGMIN